MRRLTAALAGVLLAAAPMAAAADALRDCRTHRDAAEQIEACGNVIASSGASRAEKAVAYRIRGEARSSAGASEDAIADFTASLALDPNDAAVYAGRAGVFLKAGKPDNAILDYDEALRLAQSPGATVTYLIGRGHTYMVRGNPEQAIEDFTEAIRLNPRSASAFNHRGLARRRAGDPTGAIEDYTTALALNPVYALAYNNRGYVYEAIGRRDAAIEDFRRALLLDRSLVGAQEGLKRLKAPDPLAVESEALVRQGKGIAEAVCSFCHAVGPAGRSPNEKAPEFRNLARRHPVLALREPLSRGIAAPHEQMPRFDFKREEIDQIVAYINSLQYARGE